MCDTRAPVSRHAIALLCLVLLPITASAQITGLAGVVRDTSGAVLPGVTVSASSPSPALIEKVRTAVSDGQGRFRSALQRAAQRFQCGDALWV